jgi:hypothetical protein
MPSARLIEDRLVAFVLPTQGKRPRTDREGEGEGGAAAAAAAMTSARRRMQRWFGRDVDVEQSASGELSLRSFRATPAPPAVGSDVMELSCSWSFEDDSLAQRALALLTQPPA